MAHKDTLVIIGNGFDTWKGLETGYDYFRRYYLAHRDEIMKKLRVKWKIFVDQDDKTQRISDVELIYGNPFEPEELGKDFWHVFEMSLDCLDAERLNLFFGKEKTGLRKFRKSLRNAQRILRKAFCDWIATIPIDDKNADFRFGDNCVFINFNYTPTLEKHFHVSEADVIHVHGSADDKDSIIFGHSSHPQLPVRELYQLGGRFRGLYFIEEVLYATDKHVQENIRDLCMELAIRGIQAEDIKHVYVLGHSMGLPDIEYFRFLIDSTSVPRVEPEQKNEDRGNQNPLDELAARMQYAIHRYGYSNDDPAIDETEVAATVHRFNVEQDARDRYFEREVFKALRKTVRRHRGSACEEAKEPCSRTKDAEWYISCFSEKDKLWTEHVMSELGCQRYKLYPTIGECLAEMEKE